MASSRELQAVNAFLAKEMRRAATARRFKRVRSFYTRTKFAASMASWRASGRAGAAGANGAQEDRQALTRTTDFDNGSDEEGTLDFEPPLRVKYAFELKHGPHSGV